MPFHSNQWNGSNWINNTSFQKQEVVIGTCILWNNLFPSQSYLSLYIVPLFAFFLFWSWVLNCSFYSTQHVWEWNFSHTPDGIRSHVRTSFDDQISQMHSSSWIRLKQASYDKSVQLSQLRQKSKNSGGEKVRGRMLHFMELLQKSHSSLRGGCTVNSNEFSSHPPPLYWEEAENLGMEYKQRLILSVCICIIMN